MKKIGELPQELAERLELPGELLPQSGSVRITAGRQALVEGQRGILEYSDERIVLALRKGKIILSGSGMSLRAMGQGEILIRGRIRMVEWE